MSLRMTWASQLASMCRQRDPNAYRSHTVDATFWPASRQHLRDCEPNIHCRSSASFHLLSRDDGRPRSRSSLRPWPYLHTISPVKLPSSHARSTHPAFSENGLQHTCSGVHASSRAPVFDRDSRRAKQQMGHIASNGIAEDKSYITPESLTTPAFVPSHALPACRRSHDCRPDISHRLPRR